MMCKILVVSDVHQDDRALESALSHAKNYDQIWFLGDVVGHEDHVLHKYSDYKGDARVCYELLKHHNAHCILGNWESWLLQPEKDLDTKSHQNKFVDELVRARTAMGENGLLSWVSTWPQTLKFDPFTLVHGSFDSNEDYLLPRNIDEIKRTILYKKIPTPHMLFGHTHIPGFFTYNNYHNPEWEFIGETDLKKKFSYQVENINHVVHFFINPGSANLNRKKLQNGFWSGVYGTVLEIDTKNHTFSYQPVIVG